MSGQVVLHEDTNSSNGRGITGGAFRGLPLLTAAQGIDGNVYLPNDFADLSTVSAGFSAGYEWRGAAIIPAADVGGVAQFTTGTTAYNTAGICTGGVNELHFSNIGFATTDPRWAVESRLQINRTTDFSLIVGVAVFDADFDGLLNGSGVIPTNQGNVFCHFITSGGTLKTSPKYVTDAPALQTVGSDLGTALVADTYLKLGMRYEPDSPKPELKFLVNGATVGTLDSDSLATTTTGGNIKMFVLCQTHNTTALVMKMDYFNVYTDVN